MLLIPLKTDSARRRALSWLVKLQRRNPVLLNRREFRDYGGLKAQLSCFQNDGNFFKISSLLTLFCATGHPFWRLSTVKQKHRTWSAPLLKAWHQHPLQPLEKSSSPCIEKHRAPAVGTNKDRDSWLKGFSEGRAGRNGRNVFLEAENF